MPGDKQAFNVAMNAADRHRWDSHWAEALQAYQQALAEFPEDVVARSGLGYCYMQTKQWQQSLVEYEQALVGDPVNVIALSKTAELYGILNRRSDAYEAYMRLAELYMQAAQGGRAEAAWQKAIQLVPGNPAPHEQLASYYFEKKDFVRMIAQRLAAAQIYLPQNELERARIQCEEVLHVDEHNVQAHYLLRRILAGGMEVSPAAEGKVSFSPLLNSDTNIDDSAMMSGPPQGGSDQSAANAVLSGNNSGGNTGIMGNMGSAGNYGGAYNPGPDPTMAGNGGMHSAPQQRQQISAGQVTSALEQAQLFSNQGRFNDAINLCEQILGSGFDRPDARYFLGWLYQEQQRWDEAIQQFQALLEDAEYALSCYYALGQCYRAGGDLRTAAMHFDEAVDRVNLDALTVEESDQLVQLCQEAAESHRLLGEQEQALTVFNALLGFLRSRGWDDKVSQVEYMLQQVQQAPAANTPPPQSGPDLMGNDIPEAPTMAFEATSLAANNAAPAAQTPQPQTGPAGAAGDLPDWLTGILDEDNKTQQAQPVAPPPPPPVEQAPPPPASSSWLTDDSHATANATKSLPEPVEQVQPVAPPPPPPPPVAPAPVQAAPAPVQPPPAPSAPMPVVPAASAVPSAPLPPLEAPIPAPSAFDQLSGPILSAPLVTTPLPPQQSSLEDLLGQMSGQQNQGLHDVAEAVLVSTAMLPENVRIQVVRSMQDIQKYINHGLLTPATEECLRVINIAPQYLDVHQVLCEIYVRQGKVEQAITKYGILVDTYIASGRIDDAIATYRRILQLEPNNITYRMRVIELLSAHGNREDLLRERTLAAESYLRLGYVDRAMTELEQALQENPTNVPTRLNYALALQKLGRMQQAVAEYQRVLQIDPRNLTALIRWHIAMITSQGTPRATSLEALSRIRWQLRGEGQRQADAVIREYLQALDIYPNNADVHYALGQIYHQSGQYDLAIDSYLFATRDNGVNVLARASAAQALLSQGKPDIAIQHLEQALYEVRGNSRLIDPAVWATRPREEGEEHQAPEMEISFQLANAYGRTGRQEQMQAILRQVKQGRPAREQVTSTLSDLPSRPSNPDEIMHEHMGLVQRYRQNRQIDNALNALNEMVRFAPNDPRPHEELADIYVNRGLLDEGISELRILADIYLRNGQIEQAAEAIQRIGTIYSDTGNEDDALSNLFRAAELNPTSMDLLREVVGFCLQAGRNQDAARYQIQIARYYFETNQVKEAVAALQQLITIDHSNFEAYDMLGQTYQSVGEFEQASRVYRNLAKVNPGSPVARERLAALQGIRTTQ